MPSTKSREMAFYYMHPQNRFWRVLEKEFNKKIDASIDDKKRFLTKHKIALWDVIVSCEIDGSQDATIKNVNINKIPLYYYNFFTIYNSSSSLYS